MRTFAELLTEYIARAGISDSELARSIGVRRQTLFRWKDGQIQRPRYRDDVVRCAKRLRLNPEERDLLLVAAGFSPETPPIAPADPKPQETPPPPDTASQAIEAAEEPGPRQDVASSRRPWVIGFVGGAVIIVGIVLATAMLSGDEDPPAVAVVPPTETPTPQPTVAPQTPTAVPTTPALKASALKQEPETEQEPEPTPEPESKKDIVVIAKFVNYIGGETGYNVAGRIRAALEDELEAGFLPDVEIKVLTEDIRDEAEAQQVAQRTGASVVIWGEYDSGRAHARFTVPALLGSMEESHVERPVASSKDLTATINTALPHDVRLLALLAFAQLYMGGEDSEEAREAIAGALTTLPEESDTVATLYFRLAYLHQVNEPPNLAAAEKYYTFAILYWPSSPTPYYNRGIVYAMKGDFDDAIADYTESLFRNPRNPSVLFNRGNAYLERGMSGDVVRAIDDFSKAVEIDNTITEYQYNRAIAYYKMGERFYGDALADMLGVHKLEPDSPKYNRSVCWLLTATQQAEKAIPYCDAAVEGGFEGAHFDRGTAYLELGGVEALWNAISDFNESLRIEPDDVSSYLHRGLAHLKLGGAYDDRALEDTRHILTIDPDHTGALNNLCWFMSLAGRAEEGLPYCERVLKINPEYYLAHDSRGLAHALLGERDKALDDFTKFLDWLDTQPSDTYERYGPRRERWIESLSKGENPFDETELLALRNE